MDNVALKKSVTAVVLFTVIASVFLVPSAHAYSNAEYCFSITPPEGWLAQEQTEGAAVVVFTDTFVSFTGVSVNIAVEETSKSLSEVIPEAKQELNNTLEGFQLVSEGNHVIGNVNCYEIVWTWNYSTIEMKSKQVLAVEYGKMFLLSCAALAEQYGHSEPDFENCLDSFRVEDPSQTGTASDNTVVIIIGVAVIAAVIAIVAVLAPRKKKRRRHR